MSTVDEATQTFIKNLHEKTGTSLEGWVEIAKGSGFAKHKEIVNYLKAEKGLTHGYANLVALHTLDPNRGSASSDDQFEAIFAGSKQPFRAPFDKILDVIKSFGGDLEISPKKSYVSIRRKRQFVTLEPKSSRLDVGINLGEHGVTDRLEAVPNPGMMPSHRVKVISDSEVDGELANWLRAAYDKAV